MASEDFTAMDIDTEAFEAGLAMIENMLSSTDTSFTNFIATIGAVSGALSSAVSGWVGMISTVHAGFSGMISGVEGLFSGMGAGAEAATSSMTSTITSLFSSIDVITDGEISKLTDKIGKATGITGEKFSEILNIASIFKENFLGLCSTILQGFLMALNIGAVLGLVTAGLGLLYQTYGEQIDQILFMMMEKGPEIIMNLCNGITTALPSLIEQGAYLLNQLMTVITTNLPYIISGGTQILYGLITGIAAQLPMLIPTALQMIMTLVSSLAGNIPTIISAGIQLIGGLVVGLINAIPKIVSSIPQIIASIRDGFTSVDWGEIGSNIITGIKNGLTKAAKFLMDAVKDLASSAVNWVKDKLGIGSPSKVFRDEVGKMMAVGLGIGFERNVPRKQLKKGIDDIVGNVQQDVIQALSYNGKNLVSANGYTGGIYLAGQSVFDFDEYERRQRKLNRERDMRPVFLNGRQVNRALKEGGLVTI